VNLTEIFRNPKIALVEGGNLEIDNPDFDPNQPESPNNPKVIQAQEIQLAPTEISDEVQDRTHMVGVLKNLFMDINKTFTVIYKTPLFNPAILDKEIKDFMAGSSQHFFDLLRPNPNFNPKHPESEQNPKMIGISDEEFKKYKPTVGDIDIQCNQELQDKILEFLTNNVKRPVGNAILLGPPSAGNEQYNTLWQLSDPPIKVQIDFEYGRYSPITQKPDEWTKFSHSSAWEDIQQNIKGVFHKYIYRALAKAVPTEKYIAKLDGRGKARAIAISGPVTDANFSFSVASKGGGGIRAKYKPYIDPATGQEKAIDGIPVLEPLESKDSEYVQDLNKQFSLFFGRAPTGDDRKLQDSFVGTMELMNKYLDDNAKRRAVSDFFNIVFEPGVQMITKGNPKRDYAVKFAAIDKMLEVLGLQDMSQTAETMAQKYEKDYLDLENFKRSYKPTKDQAGKKLQYGKLRKDAIATGTWKPLAENFTNGKSKHKSLNEAEVKAQFRKGMPHLHDLKPADLLDLLDEIQDGNGNFKLQKIPLNLKIDGFGGRFGKNSEGKPFMGTSNTEPRYAPGFVDYHQKKGTTDTKVLDRAKLFDNLFGEMMSAIKLVDSKLGPGFLINKQVSCEVLYLPFAEETDEGKLKFVGIHYDKLPSGVKLALVPFHITDATTGDTLPNGNEIVKELTSAGRMGSVMFIDNSLTQKEGLDVTALVEPVGNIDELKAMLASGKLAKKREAKELLAPVALALEKAIINDPNIIGKDMLGQDYEGIVINSRLGPIKVTSQEQRDIITAKNAAKVDARTERPRENSNKTAVVAVGSFVGHIGHQELFKLTIDKATSIGGDPYLFMGSRVGKDDPVPINDKLKTWKMLYPQYANNISAMTQPGGSLIQKMKHELINPLEGKPPRYDNVIIMTGKEEEEEENAEKRKWPSVLMKAVNKFQGYEHVKSSIEFTPRGTGMSFTQLRNVLKNTNLTPDQQFEIWNKGFNNGASGAEKLPPEWIKHLMDISGANMQTQKSVQKPTPKAQTEKQPVPQLDPTPIAEQRILNALVEGTSIDSTLRAIINDIGEPITSVYDTMKFQAKKYMENHGELGRGFRMVAAGVGGRWVQNMYIGRLHNELYDLCKYNTRRTVDLKDFLRGEEADGEIEMKRSFGNLANNLPPILAKLGEQINAPQLTRNARRWMQNKAEYERYLMDLEAEGDDETDDEPVIKPPKSNMVGQQNAQVDQIVNDILSKVPKNIAGDIRNAIARAPNKLAALKQELDRHHVTMSEDNAMRHMAKDLTGHGSPIAKAAAQRDKKREQHGAQSHGRAEGPKWDAVEGQKQKKKKTSRSLSRYFFPGYGYYGGGDSGEDGGDGGGGESVKQGVAEGKEKYNRELNQKGFFFEQEIDGVTYRVSNVKGGSDNIKIHALDKKQQVIGSVSFWRHQYQDGLESLSTQVDPAWRGKGIATNMYAVMRMLGVNIHPATHQTDDGKKMWDKWRKNGDAKHIKSMNAKMTGVAEGLGKQIHGTFQSMGDSFSDAHLAKGISYFLQGRHQEGENWLRGKIPEKAQHAVFSKLKTLQAQPGVDINKNPNIQKYIDDELVPWVKRQIQQGVAEARMSAAQRLWNAEQKQRAKSDASLARTPSSIPKPEPKKDEKIAEKIKGTDGKACWKGKRYAGTKNGKDVCIPVSEDVENIMDALINKIVVNEAISNNRK